MENGIELVLMCVFGVCLNVPEMHIFDLEMIESNLVLLLFWCTFGEDLRMREDERGQKVHIYGTRIRAPINQRDFLVNPRFLVALTRNSNIKIKFLNALVGCLCQACP